jgi:hypothetical protein
MGGDRVCSIEEATGGVGGVVEETKQFSGRGRAG